METKMKALLIGASGLTGGHCLRLLLNDTFYNEVEIWVRKSTGIKHPKLIEKIIDFNVIETFNNTDAQHVFCCLGTTIKNAGNQENFHKIDHDYVIAAATIAARSGAEKFLYISSIGADSKSKNFYLRTKGKVEDDLKNIFKNGLVIFRPSMLMGKRQEFRFGEVMSKPIMRVFGFLFIGKLKKYKGIEASTVAEAMVRCAKSEVKGLLIMPSDKIAALAGTA
ncbi:MAG TPA: NAD(P)H-binding protein [Bacteroidales bacterium]|nr:NAD(P)H-binding protein [Bacteroidales bacterium]HNZ43739.1 NAD(P)H-binding protein [Bacteroidales bacterium]HOH84070.1 NAD(P)H-binding protein [Bacteroidales bacterium]HPB24147.1 NAD(P)H-binding protein [Bacteroidales bacterium]HPI29555.1 NAD(P)H-binding protein [Bacteroidales bacterium]